MPGMSGSLGPTLPDFFCDALPRANMPGFFGSGVSTVSSASASSGTSATVNKGIAAMCKVWLPIKLKGIIIPQTTAIAVTAQDFTLGLWTAVADGSGNWSPTALYDTNLQGTINIPTSAGNVTHHYLTFTASRLVPPGDYFIGGCYRNVAATSTGAFETAVLKRAMATSAANPGRYDIHSTTNVTFTTGDISALFNGLAWSDVSGGSYANINFALWCERLT